MRFFSLLPLVLAALSLAPRAGAIPVLMTISCDNDYELYVDGRYVGSQTQDGFYGWELPDTRALNIDPVDAVIAIKATDEGGPEGSGTGIGLIVKIEFLFSVLAVTDSTWRVADAEAPGWTTRGFDDSGWANALDEGPFDALPWSLLALPILPFATGGARWIWRGHPPYREGFGYTNPDGAYTTCYFRKHVRRRVPTAVEPLSWSAVKSLFGS